ncbi:MAG: hypothetical protein DHS20C15_01260 [Planctomycetota bacterium]|nr:MAG: hypothetical protein DHS20C15_01260 [Planctomycetota bacterium]
MLTERSSSLHGARALCWSLCVSLSLASCSVSRETPSAAPLAPISVSEMQRLYRGLPLHRAPGLPGHRAARTWLDEEVSALGLAGEWSPASPPAWDGPALANLELRLNASPSKPLLLLVCHYDSVPASPGADDNGSGTVGLLALARRLAPRNLPVEIGLVFFDGEELGLLGSRRYAQALPDRERERLIGVINLETIAYRDTRPGSQELPPGFELLLDPGDVGDFLAVVGNMASQDLADAVALGLTSLPPERLRTVAYSGVPGNGWLVPDTRRSDHASFWDIDVPAVMLTDTANFRNPHYHRSSDRVETLDLEFLVAVLQGVERSVLLLAEEAADG